MQSVSFASKETLKLLFYSVLFVCLAVACAEIPFSLDSHAGEADAASKAQEAVEGDGALQQKEGAQKAMGDVDLGKDGEEDKDGGRPSQKKEPAKGGKDEAGAQGAQEKKPVKGDKEDGAAKKDGAAKGAKEQAGGEKEDGAQKGDEGEKADGAPSKDGGKDGKAGEQKKPAKDANRKRWPSLDSLITSPFGIPRAINGGGMHTGMDIRAHLGWPVCALKGGTVVFCGWRGNAGIAVEIAQSDGLHASYAHLARALVAPGQKVAKGEHIGLVGCTGRTTGAHLHLSLKSGDRLVNPRPHVEGGWELFDPPASELGGEIDAQSCGGVIMYGSGPAGGYRLAPGAGYGDLYRRRGGDPRILRNPRLRGTQNYLRMQKALKRLHLD